MGQNMTRNTFPRDICLLYRKKRKYILISPYMLVWKQCRERRNNSTCKNCSKVTSEQKQCHCQLSFPLFLLFLPYLYPLSRRALHSLQNAPFPLLLFSLAETSLCSPSSRSLHLPPPLNLASVGTTLLLLTSPASFAASRRIRENPNSRNCCSAGPKNWLKEQKRKASKFLLAPVDASRQILRSAYLTLSTFFPLFSLAMFLSLTWFRFGSICSENRRCLYG